MKNEVLERIAQIKDQRDHDRMISRLTAGLMLHTRMEADGIALICWLTDEPVRSNQEALSLWIEKQLKPADLADGHSVIQKLSQRLAALLSDVLENH